MRVNNRYVNSTRGTSSNWELRVCVTLAWISKDPKRWCEVSVYYKITTKWCSTCYISASAWTMVALMNTDSHHQRSLLLIWLRGISLWLIDNYKFKFLREAIWLRDILLCLYHNCNCRLLSDSHKLVNGSWILWANVCVNTGLVGESLKPYVVCMVTPQIKK